MPTEITQSRDQLRKRVDRFLHSPAHSRAEILNTLLRLSQFGHVIVFGGAIRDLAIHGNSEFPSDIDVVLEDANIEELSVGMNVLNAFRNRFGGFRFTTEKWKFDVWRLEDTWALREGHVSGQSAESLLKTTFFDWDAIAYDFTNRQLLVSDGYFDRLQRRIVDINLEPNPNPMGSARRALDIYWSGKVGLAPRLARFVATTMQPNFDECDQQREVGQQTVLRGFLRDFARSEGGIVKRWVEQLRLA